MAVKTDKNVAGLYDGSAIDSIVVRLHSNDGYEVDFNIWEDEDGTYHVFAEADNSTEDFLAEYYPDELEKYRQMVESIPTDSSWDRAGVNRFIASQTYNSIRPIEEDIEWCEWLTIDENEYYRD